MKILHIMQGMSSCQSLKNALTLQKLDNHNVLSIFDDLAVGELFSENNVQGLANRQQFWNQYRFDEYTQNMMEIINFPLYNYDKIIIWHTDTASDYLAMYWVCSLLVKQKTTTQIDEIYVSAEESGYQRSHLDWFAFGLASPEKLCEFFPLQRPFPQEKIVEYAKKWETWRVSDSKLRIYQVDNQSDNDEKVLAVDESYFDEDILALCTEDFQKASRLIGKCLSYIPHPIGDLFYQLRVNHLIKEKRLIADNDDLSFMREYSVRLST